MTVKKLLHIGGRITLCAATIAAMGWGFVALNAPDEESGTSAIGVKESSADIFSMSFAERTRTQKFQESLDRMGHEKPRVYDLNGNTVMFSVNLVHGRPERVVEQYMRTFAEEGVNPVVFSGDPNPDPKEKSHLLEASVKGGVIPWVIQDEYFSIGGGIIDSVYDKNDGRLERGLRARNENLEPVLDRFEEAWEYCDGDPAALKAAQANPDPTILGRPKKKDQVKPKVSSACAQEGASGGVCDDSGYRSQQLHQRQLAAAQVVEENPEMMKCSRLREAFSAISGFRFDEFTSSVKAFRSIEGWYNRATGNTRVAATWSDETFDMRKTQPTRYGMKVDTEAAKKVPLCHNCRRTWAFQGTGREKGYSSNVIISPHSPTATAQFYQQALLDEEWEIPEADIVVDEMARMYGRYPTDDIWLRMRRGKDTIALQIATGDDGRTVVRTTVAP